MATHGRALIAALKDLMGRVWRAQGGLVSTLPSGPDRLPFEGRVVDPNAASHCHLTMACDVIHKTSQVSETWEVCLCAYTGCSCSGLRNL